MVSACLCFWSAHAEYRLRAICQTQAEIKQLLHVMFCKFGNQIAVWHVQYPSFHLDSVGDM